MASVKALYMCTHCEGTKRLGDKPNCYGGACGQCPGALLLRVPDDPTPQADGDSTRMYLPDDSAVRKDMPICTGVLDYFPRAIAAVARLSKKGNDKHNPGEPMHWARGKSEDHADCIARHLIDRGNIDPGSGESHTVALAWRALALLEQEEEKRTGGRMSRASKVASDTDNMKANRADCMCPSGFACNSCMASE